MRQQPFASPEEALAHYGVKGMRWGHRKDRASELQGLLGSEPITRTTANGDQFTLSQTPTKLHKALAFASKGYAEKYGKTAYMKVQDKDGKTIGELNFWNKGKDNLYVNWVTVEKSARGRGYASALMRSAEDQARASGMKRMTLEVPGNAPDARHIYTRMGFKVIKEPTAKEAKNDSVWGGLTHMEKRLDD